MNFIAEVFINTCMLQKPACGDGLSGSFRYLHLETCMNVTCVKIASSLGVQYLFL